MNVLISTIVRNREQFLGKWYENIKALIDLNKDIKFDVSVYENDSIDDSKAILESFDYSFLNKSFVSSENIATEYYGSIVSEDRVNNLAKARNKTLDQVDNLSDYDKVLVIEPDIDYDVKEGSELLRTEYDIVSGTTPHPHVPIYDNWCTRLKETDSSWPIFIGLDSFENDIIPVWTTFNCFCVYKAEPFIAGARYSGFNERLNTFDCDTVVICEEFRKLGFENIVLDRTFEVKHFS